MYVVLSSYLCFVLTVLLAYTGLTDWTWQDPLFTNLFSYIHKLEITQYSGHPLNVNTLLLTAKFSNLQELILPLDLKWPESTLHHPSALFCKANERAWVLPTNSSDIDFIRNPLLPKLQRFKGPVFLLQLMHKCTVCLQLYMVYLILTLFSLACTCGHL